MIASRSQTHPRRALPFFGSGKAVGRVPTKGQNLVTDLHISSKLPTGSGAVCAGSNPAEGTIATKCGLADQCAAQVTSRRPKPSERPTRIQVSARLAKQALAH